MTSIPWNRINTGLLLLVLVAIIGLSASRAYGGPLDPPVAPASSPGGIDGRIPIRQPASAADFPIVISQPGSYYLASNITGVDGKNGIEIAANAVTLDLAGFVILGSGSLSLNGIYAAPPLGDINIHSGNVENWGAGGIILPQAFRATLSDLNVSFNGHLAGQACIWLGEANIVRHVSARQCKVGIRLDPLAGQNGDEILDSNIGQNAEQGIIVNSNNAKIERNVFDANFGSGLWLAGNYIIVTDNRFTGNNQLNTAGEFGIKMSGDFNTIVRNIFLGNAGGYLGPLPVPVGNRIGNLSTNATTNVDGWSNIGY